MHCGKETMQRTWILSRRAQTQASDGPNVCVLGFITGEYLPYMLITSVASCPLVP